MRGAQNGVVQLDGTIQKNVRPIISSLAPSNGRETSTFQYQPQMPRIYHTTSNLSQTTSNGYGEGDSESEEDEDEEDGGLHMRAQRVGNGAAVQDAPTLERSHSELSRRSKHSHYRRLNGESKHAHETGREGEGAETVAVAVAGAVAKKKVRHGWSSQLENAEQAAALAHGYYTYFEDKRHETAGNPPSDYDHQNKSVATAVSDWRMRDRLKTVSAILAVCLNVGVDPPDVIKTIPCARLECWVDPLPPDGAGGGVAGTTSSSQSNSTNAQIGKNLQGQYENLSLRTRYKVILDPTIEEVKRYTVSLRRNAREERILFHYNGHGVPKPTARAAGAEGSSAQAAPVGGGEIWCFNRSYTQYIPVSLYDMQEWVGAPGLWVWDCSAAGGIIGGFLDGAKKHFELQQQAGPASGSGQPQQTLTRWEDSIHLAACRENETLPTNPDLPADLFTSCLTTPITMAVRFFVLQNPLSTATGPAGITLDQARNIPGKVSERRTPLGELNWIFTAITDTIAWNMLPKPLFKKLFRQDLMVAALFRNFLLAQRVMRIYHCHPQSWPRIPDTFDHPLWRSWDLAVEMILGQLVGPGGLIEQQEVNDKALENQPAAPPGAPAPQQAPQVQVQELEYTHSDFFADQLSAFEVYLSSAPSTTLGQTQKPPEQLPIVLQVLLSQVHRLRALILLSKFLDLGPWAVNLALSIGIFPYVLKLLQSQAFELKPPMVFIWARILAVDQTCQADLLKDSGYTYFTAILNGGSGIPVGNMAEHRAMCAFVIAMFCKDFKPGKAAVIEQCGSELIESCLQHLMDLENPLLRQFSCLCLSNLWKDYPPAKDLGFARQAHARIRDRSHDIVPEVRSACLDALSTFVGTGEIEPAIVHEEETLASVVVSVGMDGSIMVRKELTIFYSTFTKKYEKRMIVAAWEQLLEERDKRAGRDADKDIEDQKAGHGQEDGVGEDPAEDGGTGFAEPSTFVNGGYHHQRQISSSRSETASSMSMDQSRISAMKPSRTLSKKTIYRAVWRQTLSMSADPHPEVAKNASIIVDYVINALLESPLGAYANEVLDELVVNDAKKAHRERAGPDNLQLQALDGLGRQRSKDSGRPQTPPSPSASTMSGKPDGASYFSGLSRTASVAAAMKNLVGWTARPSSSTESTPPSPTRSQRGSMHGAPEKLPYRSRPLTPADAATMAPNALDNITGPPHQPPAKIPPSPGFVARDMSKVPEIPLQSKFFTWSTSYFREAQMRPSETEEPGSLDYNSRLWRRNRNDRIIGSNQPLKEVAGTQRWDVPCGYFGIGAAPVKMVFHQFENHLVTSDDRDSIAVWDWEQATQLARFSNGNPLGSRVTEMRFINEDDQAMLMTGSSDGVIKIFRNYSDPHRIELASGFRALSDLVVSDKQNAGLVFDWQQGKGRILVAGDDRVIRVWQAGSELCITDIPARSGSCITSLTSDQVEGNVFVAGFGNGSMRVYDQRLSTRESMVMDWVDRRTDHKSWIVGLHLQRGGLRELISAESNGGIRLWDLRNRKPLSALEGKPHQPRNLRSVSVHAHAPVFATGSADHTIRVYNTQLKHLSSFEPYMSYLRLSGAARNAPITATAFHPHRMMLACGAVNDGHVNLFKCEEVVARRDSTVKEVA